MNAYSTSASSWREHLAALTTLRTPPAVRITTAVATDLYGLHNPEVCGCPAGTAPLACQSFTPARLPGICHTMHVVAPWTADGAMHGVWVVDATEGGPGASTELFGPWMELPEAIEWAAAVSAAELRQG